jgi:hypothetical protein
MATPTSGAVARSELRTHTAPVLEAIALRHQIAVLERSRTRRPCLRCWDRVFWILLSRWWPGWRQSLVIVQPETVLRWRRRGWKSDNECNKRSDFTGILSVNRPYWIPVWRSRGDSNHRSSLWFLAHTKGSKYQRGH